MRIISLEPFITELINYYECANSIVGVSHHSELEGLDAPAVVTLGNRLSKRSLNPATLALEDCLSFYQVDLNQLRSLQPDLILTSLPFERAGKELEQALGSALTKNFGAPVQIRSISPLTFDQVLEGYERVADLLGVKTKGTDLSHRCKAQVMDWADNFYDRMKNKKVTFISSVAPLALGGRWIVDMIRLCSGISQSQSVEFDDPAVDWSEIVSFKPDVIIVAPKSADMQSAMATFKAFEKLKEWDQLPAVKRGEVVFTEGQKNFHKPGPHLIDSMGILVSAIAGLESGYITPRDSFYRLRWMEMQRHRY